MPLPSWISCCPDCAEPNCAVRLFERFAANMVTGSANINLSTRMLGGKG
jgi:hypothetical protein